MNFKACVFAAALLLTGNFVSANNAVELNPFGAPVVQNQNQKIDAAILAHIIEDHATDLFNLSAEDAWAAYYSGELEITELVPGEEYKLVYGNIVEGLLVDSF